MEIGNPLGISEIDLYSSGNSDSVIMFGNRFGNWRGN